MISMKRVGMVVALVAALGFPSAAGALSISNLSDLRDLLLGWSQQLKDQNPDWRYTRYPRPRDTQPDRGVPEPTAALLFGLGVAVVAQRSRKQR